MTLTLTFISDYPTAIANDAMFTIKRFCKNILNPNAAIYIQIY